MNFLHESAGPGEKIFPTSVTVATLILRTIKMANLHVAVGIGPSQNLFVGDHLLSAQGVGGERVKSLNGSGIAPKGTYGDFAM